jgi:hypothetical protein
MDELLKYDTKTSDDLSIPEITIDRDGFYESLKLMMTDELELPLKVVKLDMDSVVIDTGTSDDRELIEFSLDDLKDPEMNIGLKILLMLIISSKTMSVPSLVFTFIFDDNGDATTDESDLVLTDAAIKEFNNKYIAYNEESFNEADHILEVKSRYLLNRLVEDKIIDFTEFTYPDQYVSTNGQVLVTKLGDTVDEVTSNQSMNPKNEAKNFSSSAQLKLYRRNRTRYKRRLRLARLKDPAGYRQRKLAAKLRWRKNRLSIIRGMKKYKRSTKYRNLVRVRGTMQ